MTHILFLHVWARATAEQLAARLGRPVPSGAADDAGTSTLEILLWAAAAVVAVGAIAAAVFAWLTDKSKAVTQN